jgi:hypothetical protein
LSTQQGPFIHITQQENKMLFSVSISTVPTWLHIPVISKHNNDEQYIWELASNTFTITPDTINPSGRSTQIP